jgi:transcriptional regulator with XRE-family HTH domain
MKIINTASLDKMILKIRKKQKLTQADLAAASGFPSLYFDLGRAFSQGSCYNQKVSSK